LDRYRKGGVPFGCNGPTLELVQALVRNWASDMVLLFSFNSINRALKNPKVKHTSTRFSGKRRPPS
jgi:hypothetical protein